MHRTVGAYRWMVVLSMGDGNPQMEATAEGRLYNHSPGWLAYLGSVAEEESTAEERLYKSREIF